MKKTLLFSLTILTFSTLFLSACRRKAAEPEPTPVAKKKVSKPLNAIPVEERPYVVMSPTASREIEVTVHRVPKAAESVEFLAEYQFGTSLGGNENLIELSDLPATKQFALYSRSAGGKTSFEEDVKGGSLQLMFQGADEYWLKQEWNYYDRVNAKSTTKDAALTSRDGKFSITGASLKPLRYVIIYNSPGYPAELPGNAASELYTVQAAGTPSSGDIEVKLRMNQAGDGTVYGWDGTEWIQLVSNITGSQATATGPLMESYIVIE